MLTVFAEHALEAASRAEQEMAGGRPRGPPHGVPLALKDISALRGVRVTGGSKEAPLLNLAYACEQSTTWKDRHPEL